MAGPRFCCQCGERLKYKLAASLVSRSYCNRCMPRFARARYWLIASPALCLVIGFAIGHYSGNREPFYYIGTPVKTNDIAPLPDRDASASDKGTVTRSTKQRSSSDVVSEICGAPTKSGKPCQRKVRGGGYCWQHRDKFGEKKPAPQ